MDRTFNDQNVLASAKSSLPNKQGRGFDGVQLEAGIEGTKRPFPRLGKSVTRP